MRDLQSRFSCRTKKFLTTLAFHDAKKWQRGQGACAKTTVTGQAQKKVSFKYDSICTEAWKIIGDTEDTLRESLSANLLSSSMRDSDLYYLLLCRGANNPTLDEEVKKSRPLTKQVFVQGLQRLGYEGTSEMLEPIIDYLDSDSSGAVGQAELREWLTGRLSRQTVARDVHLMLVRKDSLTLSDLEWTVEGLQRELASMLIRMSLAPLDLIRTYDKSKDGNFSKKEFLVMMKKIVRPTDEEADGLWYREIRPVIKDLFRNIAGKVRQLTGGAVGSSSPSLSMLCRACAM